MRRVLLLLVLWALTAGSAAAHPLAPSLLELRESENGPVIVVWKTSLLRPRGVSIEPVLPEGCKATTVPSPERVGSGVVARWEADCGEGDLVGRSVSVTGLRESGTNALVRVVRRDGSVVRGLLSAEHPQLLIPPRTPALTVARGYLALGVDHLLFGFDHVLFILGLLLLVDGRRKLLWTITSFTAGHSVTLALATLGFVRVPSAPVEAAIAFTILFLAAEIVQTEDRPDALVRRRPWVMAGSFGLLHGLGFAGALSEVGLPPEEIPLALLSFNVGIEIGQLMIAAVAIALWAAMERAQLRPPAPFRRLVPAYAIGALAGYWFLQRTGGWLGLLS